AHALDLGADRAGRARRDLVLARRDAGVAEVAVARAGGHRQAVEQAPVRVAHEHGRVLDGQAGGVDDRAGDVARLLEPEVDVLEHASYLDAQARAHDASALAVRAQGAAEGRAARGHAVAARAQVL